MGIYLDRPNTFLWLFDSAKRSSLKGEYQLANFNTDKFRYLYTYKDVCKYFISVDSSLNQISLTNIKDTIDHTAIKEDDFINPAEINDLYWGGRIYFRSKICIDSSDKLILSINSDSSVIQSDSLNYRKFTGNIKSIFIKNENYEPQYFVMYDKPKKTTILFYKPKAILYMIIINDFDGSKRVIDELGNLILK
jgi:hypothetical protein